MEFPELLSLQIFGQVREGLAHFFLFSPLACFLLSSPPSALHPPPPLSLIRRGGKRPASPWGWVCSNTGFCFHLSTSSHTRAAKDRPFLRVLDTSPVWALQQAGCWNALFRELGKEGQEEDHRLSYSFLHPTPCSFTPFRHELCTCSVPDWRERGPNEALGIQQGKYGFLLTVCLPSVSPGKLTLHFHGGIGGNWVRWFLGNLLF